MACVDAIANFLLKYQTFKMEMVIGGHKDVKGDEKTWMDRPHIRFIGGTGLEEFNTNELQTEKKERAKADLTAKIEDLEMTIKQLTEAIDALKAEIAEMQVQLKRAGEDREKENKEFQMTVADQRATQKLLTAALNVLKGFYAKK